MFGIEPAYLFVLQHRLPVNLMRRGWEPWLSTMATNLAIALVVAVLIWFVGIGAFLLVPRISCALILWPPRLSRLPSPACHVWHRSGLLYRMAALATVNLMRLSL